VLQHIVPRRGRSVRGRTDEGDDGERPQRRQLDQHGDEEGGADGKPGGRDADQIASLQRTTDDHVPADSDDNGQPRVRLGAGVLYERTVDGSQNSHLSVLYKILCKIISLTDYKLHYRNVNELLFFKYFANGAQNTKYRMLLLKVIETRITF